ncbi:MAG TPA: acyl-CoA desaturase [Niabella sp.]|nr:acyl-CoA desaturase [Niabella sp.]HOZ97391.1 acyl-CoA desaturase [Niabella sp.]HQW15241.1 acyl-CoA desaturase [Niabella sp.]HQX20291.1 acyl-CoA desaturase [Niabella sp.]HQX42804.1 acyl-CoA desaturase [Niabella sp.]
MSIPKFPTPPPPSFHTVLKNRVNDYFKERNQANTGNMRLFSKALFLVTGFLALYVHLVFFTPSTGWAIFECLLLSLFTSAIGFNIMHDGAHGSFSSKPWVNALAASSLNFLGANTFMWKMKHNVIHHAYTNIDGVDDDLDAKPFLRLCETQKFHKMHKYQHYYFWLVYSLLYVFWIFVSDYKKYFRGKVGDIPLKKMTWQDQFSFWGFKILHIVLFIVIPILTVGAGKWAIGFIIYAAFAGFVLSIVFQLAHTVEDTAFPVPDVTTNKVEDEWAIHQLKTTANFATKSRLACWFMGGLNFQVEHHLFPKISHIHYPKINKIIKETCTEFNVTYIEYKKLKDAIASHITHLKQLSNPNFAH